jgi:hypothetical protein
MAMLLALAISFGIILIMTGALFIVRTQLSLGTTSTNNETSRYVAESGVYQYLWRLNQDSKFFADSPTDPLNTATCVAVSRAPSVILGYFVLNIVPPTLQFPYFAIQSTGWLASNNADPNSPAPPTNPMNKSVIVADLQQKQFTDYVDFCNLSEVPAGYAGSGAVEDYKATGDVVAGPYKTNGNLRTLGDPLFESTVEFGSGESSSWIINNGSDSTYTWTNNGFSSSPWGLPAGDLPDFALNDQAGGSHNYPRLTSTMKLPTTNDLTQLDTWAQTDDQQYINANPTNPIHTAEFPGRTCIYLHGSQFDVIYYDPSTKQYMGPYTNLNLPPDGVIYVKGNSAGGNTGVDTNYFNTTNGGDKWNPTYANVFVSGTLHGPLTIVANNDIFITPYNPTQMTKCGVQGSFDPTQQSDYTGGLWYDQQLTGNNVTDSNNPDLLGLIANENVRILGSDWPDNNNTDLNNNVYYQKNITDINPNESFTKTSSHWGVSNGSDIYVQAAVMTINGVFDAEGWNGGPYATGSGTNYTGGAGIKGHLNLTGCYIMNYDGAFGVYGGSNSSYWHGYGESDAYDLRLAYETPPHFLEPQNSGWQVQNWHSVPDVIALTPNTPTLPQTKVYSSFSQTITASGGTPPYNFYVGGSLPPGFNPLGNATNSTSCVLSGIPTVANTAAKPFYSFWIIAADSNDYVGSQYYTMAVGLPGIVISASPTIPQSVTAGSSGSYQLAASGGTAPYTFSISANPGWVNVSGNTLTIDPPPGTSGRYSFTVTATDNNSYTGSQTYSLTVN